MQSRFSEDLTTFWRVPVQAQVHPFRPPVQLVVALPSDSAMPVEQYFLINTSIRDCRHIGE
jgi:hypothetical protein